MLIVFGFFAPAHAGIPESRLKEARNAGALGIGLPGTDIMGFLGEADEIVPCEALGIDVYVYEITDSPHLKKVFLWYDEDGDTGATGFGYSKEIASIGELKGSLGRDKKLEFLGESRDGKVIVFQTKEGAPGRKIYSVGVDKKDVTALYYMGLPLFEKALQ